MKNPKTKNKGRGKTFYFACLYSGENADCHPDEVATCCNLYAARRWAQVAVEYAAKCGKIATARIFRAKLAACVSAMNVPEAKGGVA